MSHSQAPFFYAKLEISQFTIKFKIFAEKATFFFFYSETNLFFEKLRIADPHEFSMRIWKKMFVVQKVNIKIKKHLRKTRLLAVRRQSVKIVFMHLIRPSASATKL